MSRHKKSKPPGAKAKKPPVCTGDRGHGPTFIEEAGLTPQEVAEFYAGLGAGEGARGEG